MEKYIDGFDPAGAALTELKKELDKQMQRFEEAKEAAAKDLELINYRVSTFGTGANRAVNLDNLTAISAKIEATAQAIDILEYYIKSFQS